MFTHEKKSNSNHLLPPYFCNYRETLELNKPISRVVILGQEVDYRY